MPESLDARDDLIEMFAVFGAEKLVHLGGCGDEGAVLRVLRIEDPHRVALEAFLRFVGEGVAVFGEVRRERLLHLGLALRVADRVHFELVRAQAELREEPRGEVDDLDVRKWLLRAETLETPLPELAIAQELRALPAEHRLVVEEPDRTRRAVKTVLEERARDRRRALRAQDEAALAVKRHVVHLVADDVARLPHRFGEYGAILDDRGHDPGVAIAEGARLDHGLEGVEGGRFFGKQVPHPARGLKTWHRDADDKPLSSKAKKSSRQSGGWRNDYDRTNEGHCRARQRGIFLVHAASRQGSEDGRALRREGAKRFL